MEQVSEGGRGNNSMLEIALLPMTPRGPLVGSAVVDAWCVFMESQGVRRVLCLLTPSELGFYSDNLLQRYAG